jgi:hypothetical protein
MEGGLEKENRRKTKRRKRRRERGKGGVGVRERYISTYILNLSIFDSAIYASIE